MKHYVTKLQLIITAACFAFTANTSVAEIVTAEVDSRAVQQVNLNLGTGPIEAELVAQGLAEYTFDVDPLTNDTIDGGNSSVDVLFKGFLPEEFAVVNLQGAAFDLFNIGQGDLSITGGGKNFSLSTNFGINVFGSDGSVAASFFTQDASLFEGEILGLDDFSNSVFADPNRPNDATEVFSVDSNDPNNAILVGTSFNRTVSAITAIPEPSSLIFGAAVVLLLGSSRRRQLV